MKGKVAFLIALAIAFLSVSAVTSAPLSFAWNGSNEDIRYIYPQIETNCDRINATAYRFNPGNTLNFTCTFTTQEEFVSVGLQKNFTHYSKVETLSGDAYFYEYVYGDGICTGGGCRFAGGEGYGSDEGAVGTYFYKGEHTIKVVCLFRTFGETDGFYVLNFLSEPIFKIEKAEPPPTLTIPLLIGGCSGATIVLSAVFWHKKNSAKKEENNVNP